jgi:hopene-associated glycosyltransferase HpnB
MSPRRELPLARTLPWVPAATWAYLTFGRGRFWSTSTALPPPVNAWPPPAPPGPTSPANIERHGAEHGPAGQGPPVAVVVPARDEAALLPRTLPALLHQDYPGHAWVVLVDDHSSDKTAEVAREIARSSRGQALGLNVVHGGPTPPGWAGKPWAMAQGVAHAMLPPGPPEWILFTDADVHHPPGSLHALVDAAVRAERDALSLMARLTTSNRWERLLMPAFVYFFAQIYPFAWVNSTARRTAAAAGGCLLVRREALERAGGIEAIATSTIDDVALARALKSSGAPIWLGLAGAGTAVLSGPGATAPPAPDVTSLRSYPGLRGIWDMVARNAYTQLRHDPAALAGTVAGLGITYLAPPVLAAAGLAARRPNWAAAGLAAWTAMTATYLPIARYYGASPATAPALPFTSLLYAGMTLSSARRYYAGQPGQGGPEVQRPHQPPTAGS